MKKKDLIIKILAGLLILLDMSFYLVNDSLGYARLFTVIALALLLRTELCGKLFKKKSTPSKT